MSWLTAEWERPWGIVADVVRLAALAGVVWALLSQPVEGALRFTIVLLILVGVRAFALPRPFDAAFGVTLLVASTASALHWYQRYPWSDVAIHFATTGATAAALYLVLARLGLLPDLHERALPHPRVTVTVLTVALGVTAGVLWEFYEWAAERYLPSTRLLVGYGDTIADLAMDLAGALVAGVVLATWSRHGHGLRPRPPRSGRAAARSGRGRVG